MARRGRNKGTRPQKGSGSVTYILEQGSVGELIANQQRANLYRKNHWKQFSEMAFQRSGIQDRLLQALSECCNPNFSFEHWQRAVKYKYSLTPLSTVGSVKGVGGRFNMGEDVNVNLPQFPALYLAADKDTALQEMFGQEKPKGSELSSTELALCSPESLSIVSVSGCLDQVIDLRDGASLKGFTDMIKGFKFTPEVLREARQLGQGPPEVITNPKKLLISLLMKNWRAFPMQFDVPANSQIFGHLAYLAGIEGIRYPSKWTGKDCLVAFPRNFSRTGSYVELDDAAPDGVSLKRVDGDNWQDCE